MEAWLTGRWYGGSAPLLLRPLSWLYGGVLALRGAAYTQGLLATHNAGKPVLVIGNLTVGGTGKTPLVIWIAQRLTALGFKVGIVSRGHGRHESAPRVVEETSDWREVGDEPLLLRRHTGCTTVVAADRVAGARVLAAQGVNVIVADDGLQHLRLRRECEIVVVDTERGFGNGALLPAGPLREPVSRLQTVDAVVLNGNVSSPLANGAFVMTLVPGEPRHVSAPILPHHRAVEGDEAAHVDFEGVRVHAVAGIGNPSRFFASLRARGIDVIEHPFPDHHAFTPHDLAFGDALPVLMTEKDAVKCRAFADPRLWYVPVAASFGEPEGRELLQRVLHKLGLSATA